MIKYLYLLIIVIISAYCQLVVKWQVDKAGVFPTDIWGKIKCIFNIMLSPWILSLFVLALLSAFTYFYALRKFELSFAYPFVVSLTLMLVVLLRATIWNETLGIFKMMGIALIILGIIFLKSG